MFEWLPLALGRSSTKSIQKRESAKENTERNPEVDVRGDGAKKIAGRTVVALRQYCDLELRS